MEMITVKFDEIFANESFWFMGYEYQRANCGPYDKKRKAFNENAEEWFTFNGKDKVQVYRYV